MYNILRRHTRVLALMYIVTCTCMYNIHVTYTWYTLHAHIFKHGAGPLLAGLRFTILYANNVVSGCLNPFDKRKVA
jgi:hypothetical protein